MFGLSTGAAPALFKYKEREKSAAVPTAQLRLIKSRLFILIALSLLVHHSYADFPTTLMLAYDLPEKNAIPEEKHLYQARSCGPSRQLQ